MAVEEAVDATLVEDAEVMVEFDIVIFVDDEDVPVGDAFFDHEEMIVVALVSESFVDDGTNIFETPVATLFVDEMALGLTV